MQQICIDLRQSEKKRRTQKIVRDLLLVCGILSSSLYIATDLLAAMRWEDYDYTAQTISELMAIGAPTRPLLVVFLSVYNALVVAFAVGIWRAVGRRRMLRVTAILIAAYGVVGQMGLLFAPMHLRGTGAVFALTDKMHIVCTSTLVLFTLLSIGFGSVVRRKGFLLYSIGTIVVLLVFGALAASRGPSIASQLPTPGVGILERVNVYASLLWAAMLSATLLWTKKQRTQECYT